MKHLGEIGSHLGGREILQQRLGHAGLYVAIDVLPTESDEFRLYDLASRHGNPKDTLDYSLTLVAPVETHAPDTPEMNARFREAQDAVLKVMLGLDRFKVTVTTSTQRFGKHIALDAPTETNPRLVSLRAECADLIGAILGCRTMLRPHPNFHVSIAKTLTPKQLKDRMRKHPVTPVPSQVPPVLPKTFELECFGGAKVAVQTVTDPEIDTFKARYMG